MTVSSLGVRLLKALYHLSKDSEIIDILSLSRSAATRPYPALRGLLALERAGFVDARRMRLTFTGLAVTRALIGQETKQAATDCADWFNATTSAAPRQRTARRTGRHAA